MGCELAQKRQKMLCCRLRLIGTRSRDGWLRCYLDGWPRTPAHAAAPLQERGISTRVGEQLTACTQRRPFHASAIWRKRVSSPLMCAPLNVYAKTQMRICKCDCEARSVLLTAIIR